MTHYLASSTNNWLWAIPSWGESWHNNHHGNSAAKTTTIKWWELDPVRYVIKVIQK